jgi:hypothetical protein
MKGKNATGYLLTILSIHHCPKNLFTQFVSFLNTNINVILLFKQTGKKYFNIIAL